MGPALGAVGYRQLDHHRRKRRTTTQAWLTTCSFDCYKTTQLVGAMAFHEPLMDRWGLRAWRHGGYSPVLLLADDEGAAVLSGLDALIERGWLPVVPDSVEHVAAAINPHAVTAVTSERPTLTGREDRPGWEVALWTSPERAWRLAEPVTDPSLPRDLRVAPAATEDRACQDIRNIVATLNELLVHPWSDPDFSHSAWTC